MCVSTSTAVKTFTSAAFNCLTSDPSWHCHIQVDAHCIMGTTDKRKPRFGSRLALRRALRAASYLLSAPQTLIAGFGQELGGSCSMPHAQSFLTGAMQMQKKQNGGTVIKFAPLPPSRRVQLDYTSPAIFFGPPGQSYDLEEEMSDNSDSVSQSAKQTAPTIHQQVRKLSLEHADLTSSAVTDASIPPTISALIRRLLEEAADPVLPRDTISRISSTSPTKSFREPRAPEIPHSKITQQLFSMSRNCLIWQGNYTPDLI